MAAFLLKIGLKDTDSPVWRTVEVPDTASFADLHSIVQSVMQWGDFCYHSFYVGFDFDADREDEMLSPISDHFGRDIAYLYDPDAGWEVEITWLERTDSDLGHTPRLVDWEGDAPPDGCLDMDDFRKFLKATENPGTPEYEEYEPMMEDWEFDPETAQSSLDTWGVQGVMPEGAKKLDPTVRMMAVMMLSSMSGLPVVFDRTEGRCMFVADSEPEEAQDWITPDEAESDPERYSIMMADPYRVFTDLVDGYSKATEGRALGGRDPQRALDSLVRTEEDVDAWGDYVINRMSDLTFDWAKENGYYFAMGDPEEGETF